MALPWYGREWPTVSCRCQRAVPARTVSASTGRTISIYSNAIQLAARYGASWTPAKCLPTRIPLGAGRRLSGNLACRSTTTTSTRSATNRLTSRRSRLAGIGIFALGYDNAQPELWKLLRVKYRGLVDHAAPPRASEPRPGDYVSANHGSADVDLSATMTARRQWRRLCSPLTSSATIPTDGTLESRPDISHDRTDRWPLDDLRLVVRPPSGARTCLCPVARCCRQLVRADQHSFNLAAPAAATSRSAAAAIHDDSTVPVPSPRCGTGDRQFSSELVRRPAA